MDSSPYKITLPKWNEQSADERRRPIIDKVVQESSRFPNMYAHMIHSPGLLETYLKGYRVFRKESGFTPVEQEVIFLTISYENDCTYCMAAHSVLAVQVSKVPQDITDAIRAGKPIADKKLSALSQFTSVLLNTRGRPSKEETLTFLAAGYKERHFLEIILALAVKTISNYTNHLFDMEVDPIFRSRQWKKPVVPAVHANEKGGE